MTNNTQNPVTVNGAGVDSRNWYSITDIIVDDHERINRVSRVDNRFLTLRELRVVLSNDYEIDFSRHSFRFCGWTYTYKTTHLSSDAGYITVEFLGHEGEKSLVDFKDWFS